MKFSEFIMEKTSYKTEISKDEILEIFKTNCKNSDIKIPLWRGMRGSEPAFILEGQKGSRQSINNSNHYTIAIDHFLKKKGSDIPLRSKSIVAGSHDMIDDVKNFGPDIYAIFPFDNVKIGVVPEYDLWGIKFEINDYLVTLNKLNGLYNDAGITDEDYFSFNRELKKYVEEHKDDKSDKLVRYFIDEDHVDSTLREIYETEMGFRFVDSRQVKHIDANEVWIGGKCLAIKLEVYNEIKKELS